MAASQQRAHHLGKLRRRLVSSVVWYTRCSSSLESRRWCTTHQAPPCRPEEGPRLLQMISGEIFSLSSVHLACTCNVDVCSFLCVVKKKKNETPAWVPLKREGHPCCCYGIA
mmetsp:Transcript_23689/g.93948  ORF Transcript_23689/g.93948 Transcript_23689/m.93948 type:complete len:112 (+) Transcript_23689:616-951(+)